MRRFPRDWLWDHSEILLTPLSSASSESELYAEFNHNKTVWSKQIIDEIDGQKRIFILILKNYV